MPNGGVRRLLNSWRGLFAFRQEDPASKAAGLRRPQIGALYATLAHWSTTDAAATVVMPTGTGVRRKTVLALLVCAQLRRVMVVVPNAALRDQIAEKFITLGKLPECGCVARRYSSARGGTAAAPAQDGGGVDGSFQAS